MQRPFWQVSPTRHRSTLLSQVVPLGSGVRVQPWAASSQVTSSQSPGAMPQSFCGPPTQSPAAH